MTIFDCEDVNGTKINVYTSKIACESGIYFIHITFAIAVSLVFVLVSLIVSLTFFDISDHDEDNTTAR